MKNIVVTMSGGTSPVINATLVGIVKAVQNLGSFDKVFAGKPGIQGLLNHSLIDLTSLSDQQLVRLRRTPGSAFTGTTRIAKLSDIEITKLSSLLEKKNIKSYINIGGNGTIKQSKILSQKLRGAITFASAPKTVDNDLGDEALEKMFFTPGFPTCINYWVKLVHLINLESLGACSHDKVLVCQTFGRDTGFIAASTAISNRHNELPLLLLLPEDKQPFHNILDSVKNFIEKFDRCIIIVSEGYELGDVGYQFDHSGQVMYGSCASTVAQRIVTALVNQNIQARSCIPTILQRQIADAMEFDLYSAEKVGEYCVNKLSDGSSDFLATVSTSLKKAEFIDSLSYSEFSDLSRKMHPKFISKGKFSPSDDYLNYIDRIIEASSAFGFENYFGYDQDLFFV